MAVTTEGRSRTCYFVMRKPDTDDPRDETGVLCLRPANHDDEHSPFSKWQPPSTDAREAT